MDEYMMISESPSFFFWRPPVHAHAMCTRSFPLLNSQRAWIRGYEVTPSLCGYFNRNHLSQVTAKPGKSVLLVSHPPPFMRMLCGRAAIAYSSVWCFRGVASGNRPNNQLKIGLASINNECWSGRLKEAGKLIFNFVWPKHSSDPLMKRMCLL